MNIRNLQRSGLAFGATATFLFCLVLNTMRQGVPSRRKKENSVPLHSSPQKARGHTTCWRWAVGSWRLATGGWWRLAAVGGWGLVVDGGWQWLAVGGWSPLAVGGWRLAVGGWRRLVVGS